MRNLRYFHLLSRAAMLIFQGRRRWIVMGLLSPGKRSDSGPSNPVYLPHLLRSPFQEVEFELYAEDLNHIVLLITLYYCPICGQTPVRSYSSRLACLDLELSPENSVCVCAPMKQGNRIAGKIAD